MRKNSKTGFVWPHFFFYFESVGRNNVLFLPTLTRHHSVRLSQCRDVGVACTRSRNSLPLCDSVLRCVRRTEVFKCSEAEGKDSHCYR